MQVKKESKKKPPKKSLRSCIQKTPGKAPMLQRAAVRDTSVSRHHGAHLRPPLKPFGSSQHYSVEGFKESRQLGLLDSQCKFFQFGKTVHKKRCIKRPSKKKGKKSDEKEALEWRLCTTTKVINVQSLSFKLYTYNIYIHISIFIIQIM